MDIRVKLNKLIFYIKVLCLCSSKVIQIFMNKTENMSQSRKNT